jgi:NAD(P)-dependent dehydrogenase (short-subunit alcohol dehydrogenase family)
VGLTLVVGGTAGIGRRVAEFYAERGDDVVLTGRDATRAKAVAAELGDPVTGAAADLSERGTVTGAAADLPERGTVTGAAVDLSEPETIAAALAGVGPVVDRIVVAALERDHNRVADYDVRKAQRLSTLKLVGYTEVVHVLLPRLAPDAAIVLFGGQAQHRPWPGSVTVSSVNGAVSALVRALAVEIAPIRVNAVHPGVIGDSPAVRAGWTDDAVRAVVDRTPLGRMATMDEVAGAVVFLLENGGVNGVNLEVDGGWLHR